MGIFGSLFASYSEKQIKKIKPIVDKIEALAERFDTMPDDDMRAYTDKLRGDLAAGKTLDDILPEAFALVREADYRILGKRPFRVQLMGAIILHQGRVAEMKTGEGKTLVATMPAYLNALTGRGVHIVTVNGYLAERDSQEMGKVYGFLGLTTGLVVSGMTKDEKRAAYAADITYGTHSEFGFDYLRDNMARSVEARVSRGQVFAIVDEVDSVFIDEARTPLIISERAEASNSLYGITNTLASKLVARRVGSLDAKSSTDYYEECFYSEEFHEPRGFLNTDGALRAMKEFSLDEEALVFDEERKMASLTEGTRDKLIDEFSFKKEDFTTDEETEELVFSDIGMKKVKDLFNKSFIIDEKLGSALFSEAGKTKAIMFFDFKEKNFFLADRERRGYALTKSGVKRAKEEFSVHEGDLLVNEKNFITNSQTKSVIFSEAGVKQAIRYFDMKDEHFVPCGKGKTFVLCEAGATALTEKIGITKRDFIYDKKTDSYSIARQAETRVKAAFTVDYLPISPKPTLFTRRGKEKLASIFKLGDEHFITERGCYYKLRGESADIMAGFLSLGADAFSLYDKKGGAYALTKRFADILGELLLIEDEDTVTDEKWQLSFPNPERLDRFERLFSLDSSDYEVSEERIGAVVRLFASGKEKIEKYFSFASPESFSVSDEGELILTKAGIELISKFLAMDTDDATILKKQGAEAICRKLDFDYIVDEKARTAVLSAQGVEKVERFFKIENLAAPENNEYAHHINIAIRAHGVMKRDVDYVVKDNTVYIVDTFTGRILNGRRFNNGLHQAIEAKEHVKVQRESKTSATITYQNFFRLYSKLSGMTGTALTEENEFREIYALDVVEVPTNRPMIRKDHKDELYLTRRAKLAAIVHQIEACHDKGQPVLIGTASVDKSEELSKILAKRGIKHNVLNAKNHSNEAAVIAGAGTLGAVTIATNMAGRGTDIMLGGNPEHMAKLRLKKDNYSDSQIVLATGTATTDDERVLQAREKYAEYYAMYKAQIEPLAQKIRELGGLFIIGTERHESRRIDNQLRGRSGRQGDPGESRFYVSFEDDLMRFFAANSLMQRVVSLYRTTNRSESTPIPPSVAPSLVERAQKRIEAANFARRKHVLTYDDVMNRQRTAIYKQRNDILELDSVRDKIDEMIRHSVEEKFDEIFSVEEYEQLDTAAFISYYSGAFTKDIPLDFTKEEFDRLNKSELCERLVLAAVAVREKHLEMMLARMQAMAARVLPEGAMPEGLEATCENALNQFEKSTFLKNIDAKWIDHLDAMEDLKGYVGLNSYAGRDPTVTYRIEGSQMFDDMIRQIREDTVVEILTRVPLASRLVVNKNDGDDEAKNEPKRNQPCPCGSGKKYKNCCMKKVSGDR